MIRLVCPLFYMRLILNAAKAIELFIRHDATLLRVEELLQHSQDQAHSDSLTQTAPAVLADRVVELADMENATR